MATVPTATTPANEFAASQSLEGINPALDTSHLPTSASLPLGPSSPTQPPPSTQPAVPTNVASDNFELPRPQPTEQQAMAGVLEELMEIGKIDAAAQQDLMRDLDRAQPSHWPLLVRQYQAALNYRQQLESQNAATISADKATQPRSLPQQKSAEEILLEPSTTTTVAATGTHSAVTNTLRAPSQAADRTQTVAYEPRDPQLPGTTERLENHARRRAAHASAAVDLNNAGDSACEFCGRGEQQNWRDALLATIEALREEIPADAGTQNDLRHQIYLRLLYVLADAHDAALDPIAGVTPSQQEYWTNQIFALTTYLDSTQQPDHRQRATSARVHLEQALRELSDLSSITVRNLAFCKSVSGFGVYEPNVGATFSAGEQISLYAEVENFRSKSTERGFRSSLATNYVIRNSDGEAVDSGQFPDVVDDCRSRRRDFHIQYGIELPGSLEAGEYELEILIKDNLSRKTGVAREQFQVAARNRGRS